MASFLFFFTSVVCLFLLVVVPANGDEKSDRLHEEFARQEKNYFDVLELPKNATVAQIKHAYRKQALKWHPDKNPSPEAQEKFIQIQKAYETLVNPESREAYEKFSEDIFHFYWDENSGIPKVYFASGNAALPIIGVCLAFTLYFIWSCCCCCGKSKPRVSSGTSASSIADVHRQRAAVLSRVFAGLLDLIIWAILTQVYQNLVNREDASEIEFSEMSSNLLTSEFFLIWLTGATFGQRLCGYKIIRRDGRGVGFFRSMFRLMAKLLTIFLVPLIGAIAIFGTVSNDDTAKSTEFFYVFLLFTCVPLLPMIWGIAPWDFVTGTRTVDMRKTFDPKKEA